MVKTAWLRFYSLDERPARFSRIIQSWDTANKAAEPNDYSVATTWGIDGANASIFSSRTFPAGSGHYALCSTAKYRQSHAPARPDGGVREWLRVATSDC